MFSSRSVQIAAVFSDVFGKALPNLCKSFYNETKAEMFFSVFAVALLAEGVDRNNHSIIGCRQKIVALLAEGVDRNILRWQRQEPREVALLAEGVDRNCRVRLCPMCQWRSPSSRRAWIEMTTASRCDKLYPSPSSRRAWIEMDSEPTAESKTSCRPPRGGRG